MQKRLLFVVNAPAFFISHRLPVAEGARQAGFEVHVATGPGNACQQIVDAGFKHHLLPLSRSGKNPWAELICFVALCWLMRKVKPELVHLVTIKPVLYGGIAARLTGVSCVVAAVSGLGSVFISQGPKARVLRGVIKPLYRLAFGHRNLKVIFQNPDDRDALVKLNALSIGQSELIRGSGARLADYPFVPEPSGSPVVAMAARLLRDKGVTEFVAVARLLKQRGVDARFWLIGDPDPGNPATVTEAEMCAWQKEGVVELLGYRRDIAQLFALSNMVVLPSYREGLPKVLVEAAACGRAVVTTDVPGCRDAIEEGETGLLVPVRNVDALADAVERLIADSSLRQRLGQAGRQLAEREFAIERIVAAHLAIYAQLEAQA